MALAFQAGSRVRARLRPVSLAVLATAVVVATVEAQKRRTGEATRTPLRRSSATPFGEATLLSLPSGADTNADWLARGAYEDWFYIPASNWWARTAGGGWMENLRVLSFGGFQARGAGGAWASCPPPFPQKISLAPMANWHMLTGRESLFWHAVTASNTLVMTWQNGLYARSHTNLVSFQAELFNDGSVAYRYDGSPAAPDDFVVPIELPFDLDGDGLENSIDPDPLAAGPDAHGTNAEWYNTVCSNVLAAVAHERDPPNSCASVELTWREGVNSNAYYFVDVVAERGPAPIRFAGDRTSRLGNPVVVARAGETNRVPLLIGISYAVTSDTPFSVSFPMDYMYPEVETNEPCVARIRWPLECAFEEILTGSTRRYAVSVGPYDPGGAFSWETSGGMLRSGIRGGGCGCVSYDGQGIVFGCTEDCMCAGSCVATGSYGFEEASFPFSGGECRCGFDDPDGSEEPPPDSPFFSAGFSRSAVIYEDAYENRPGDWKPKRSTRVLVSVSASGGPNGGSFTLSTANLGKLSPVACGPMALPSSMTLGPHEGYCESFVCEGAAESGSADDVSISGTFTENGTGEQISVNDRLTVVRVELKPMVDPPKDGTIGRHTFGVCEYVEHQQYPSAPAVRWSPTGGGSNAVHEGKSCYQCPLYGCANPLRADVGTVHYPPMIQVVEPKGVRSRVIEYIDYPDVVHKGEAGGVGMRLHLYVEPMDVSFSEISVEEVPSYTYDAKGYFANPYFNGMLGHTRLAGAGCWGNVDKDNRIGEEDEAGYREKVPWLTPNGMVTTNAAYAWTDGEVYIDNPFGWNVAGTKGDILPYKEFGHDIQNTIRIDGQGRVGVFKLDNWVSRTTNDVVRLYGPRDTDND